MQLKNKGYQYATREAANAYHWPVISC